VAHASTARDGSSRQCQGSRQTTLRRMRPGLLASFCGIFGEPPGHLCNGTIAEKRCCGSAALNEVRSVAIFPRDTKCNAAAGNMSRASSVRIMAEGVDDATWLHHLRAGDYSRWLRDSIKDDDSPMKLQLSRRTRPSLHPRAVSTSRKRSTGVTPREHEFRPGHITHPSPSEL
jgi:hypothetical protein